MFCDGEEYSVKRKSPANAGLFLLETNYCLFRTLVVDEFYEREFIFGFPFGYCLEFDVNFKPQFPYLFSGNL